MTTQQVKKPKKISEKYLYNAGIYYLKRYTASSEHFKKVMSRKIERSCKFHEDQDKQLCYEQLDKTTQLLIEQGLLNDAAYLRGMVESYRRRGLSARKITANLMTKGLKNDDIKKELKDYNARYQQEDTAADLIAALAFAKRKRFGVYRTKKISSDEEQHKIERRELSSMARAGFSYDICKKALQGSTE
jgi:regulatory protein